MRNLLYVFKYGMLAVCLAGCGPRARVKDRSEALSLFNEVTSLTERYTAKIAVAPDSASWAQLSAEYEDSLDKVNFTFSPDTDLLLTEGQNDTIVTLMSEYVRVRDERIHRLLQRAPADTVGVEVN